MTGADPEIRPTAPGPLTSRHRRRWFRLAALVAAALAVTWAASGGYERLTAPNPRWKLPNGDTIEVLVFDNYYGATYWWIGGGVTGTHALRLRFRSTLYNAARDRSDVRAAADILCPIADSAGIPVLLIQPTRASFFDVFTVSHDYAFRVRARSDCEQVSGSR